MQYFRILIIVPTYSNVIWIFLLVKDVQQGCSLTTLLKLAIIKMQFHVTQWSRVQVTWVCFRIQKPAKSSWIVSTIFHMFKSVHVICILIMKPKSARKSTKLIAYFTEKTNQTIRFMTFEGIMYYKLRYRNPEYMKFQICLEHKNWVHSENVGKWKRNFRKLTLYEENK